MALKEDFPFSQVLHAISARVSKEHNLGDPRAELQTAAVYSADRSVLKELLEQDQQIQQSSTSSSSNTSVNQAPAQGDVAATVLEDLAKLHTLKQNFELLFTGAPVSVSVQSDEKIVEPTPETASKSPSKSKKERIVEIAKSMTGSTIDGTVEVGPGFKSRKRKRDAMDTFIDQIIINKQELVPESEKQKEQIEIINHFIKVQPSITGSRDKQAANDDLSTIKTGEFGEHIVSETLVGILLKQGKKEKAIEVLKKLIWKFPQKKAYFAAQIEELKK